MIASRNVSALLCFAPHHIGSPVKGSRQLCCRGVEKNYSLSALSCGQRSPVGNGFIRSVCHGFAGTHWSGNRKNCIGNSVKALLKKCRRHTIIIHHSLFIGAVADRPIFAFPSSSARGRQWGAVQKISTAPALRAAATVSSAPSTPGYRRHMYP